MKKLDNKQEKNMGQKTKKSKYSVQKERLKNTLINLLMTTNAIMEFNLTLMSQEKDIKITKKLIRDGKKAIETISGIKHNEILVDLYNSFIVGNMPFFVAATRTMSMPKKIKHWDTEKGFKDFLKAQEKAFAQCDKELEEKKKEHEFVEKAKAEGKNVELMYHKGKIKPVVVEEKPN